MENWRIRILEAKSASSLKAYPHRLPGRNWRSRRTIPKRPHFAVFILPVVAVLGSIGIYHYWPPSSLSPSLPETPSIIQNGNLHLEPKLTKLILETETLLTRLDFHPGPIDGVLDARTAAEIRLYQQMAGLSVTGKPSTSLVEELREVSGLVDNAKGL